MFDLLLAAALAAVLLLSAMTLGSSDSSSPSFCRSTSLALSAIREANNGIYSDNDGIMYFQSFCESSHWNEGESRVPDMIAPVGVEVEGYSGYPGDPTVYPAIPAGKWIKLKAIGGDSPSTLSEARA